jgi:hypothetical protein
VSRSVNRRVDARRAILVWALVFVGLQMALALALEGPLSQLRNPDYGARRAALAQRQQTDQRPLIFVLGTSRTMYGLRPDLLDAEASPAQPYLVFNCGLPGHGVVHQYLALDRMLRDGVRPDGLVVEVVPVMLDWDVNRYDPISPLWYDWNDLQNVSQFKSKEMTTRSDWWQARLLPWYGYRFNVIDRVLPAWQTQGHQCAYYWRGLDSYGWIPMPSFRKSADGIDGSWRLFGKSLQELKVADSNRRALFMLLERCQRERIPTTVLFMPEGPTFRGWYAPGAESEVLAFAEEIKSRYKVPVVDARAWLDSEQFFTDSHHLLPDGATAFTRRFGRDVLPGLSNSIELARAQAKRMP